MTTKEELNEGHFHEALDRAFCFQDSWERLVQQHPAIEHTPELKALAEEIQDKMGTLYQTIGQYN